MLEFLIVFKPGCQKQWNNTPNTNPRNYPHRRHR